MRNCPYCKGSGQIATEQIMLASDRYEVSVGWHDDTVTLTPNLFSLLHALVKHFGLPVSKDVLMNAMWGMGDSPIDGDNVLHVQIGFLRKKIEHLGLVIHTIRDGGYYLERGKPGERGAYRWKQRKITSAA